MAGFRDFLRITEASQLLGVSPGTLRNWDRAGRVVALRHPVNGYRLYRRADLTAILRDLNTPTRTVNGRQRSRVVVSRG